ncbi:class I SAM-dependent methyltransferase [Caenispirillum salinarum]|uniref:class I SAM-dependent methyltransferase n=1 Tax=Caenispirillum salinarum TaxID=859058 RepID=UPI0038517ED9
MDILTAFGRAATTYDAQRRILIPCFDAFYGAVPAILSPRLAPDSGRGRRVLDLGAGTGLLAAVLLARYPRLAVTLIDGSPDMLEQAGQRFAALAAADGPEAAASKEVARIVGDYRTLDLRAGGPWDAVVSALSIHHLTDAEKEALYGRIHDALAPGGIFVNADQVAAATPALEGRMTVDWEDAVRAAGLPEADLEAARTRMLHDRCATAEAQLDMLRRVGFRDVDVWFRDRQFCVFAGTRAEPPAAVPQPESW